MFKGETMNTNLNPAKNIIWAIALYMRIIFILRLPFITAAGTPAFDIASFIKLLMGIFLLLYVDTQFKKITDKAQRTKVQKSSIILLIFFLLAFSVDYLPRAAVWPVSALYAICAVKVVIALILSSVLTRKIV